MSILWVDFETRSRVDLPSKGAYNYCQDRSTEVLCMAYAFDDEDVQVWMPDEPFPERVVKHTGQIRAHNAAFERLIFWYVLQIDFKLEQFYCTAAQARANCAPGSLEDVGRFASVNMRKDHRGAQLIRLLSIPQSDGTFRQDSALLAEMVAYCRQDVVAMRAVSLAMRNLSDEELHDYQVNERINDRGVKVDVDLCEAAVRYADAELLEIQQIVQEVTNGEIRSVRSPKMREWVLARVGPQALKLMTVHKDDEQKFSIDKSVRANLLALAEENPDEVPPDVAEVIQCADDLWASSVAKFSRLQALADVEDARVRGAFVFAGGSATGRASSYGAQVHNFTRQCAKDPEAVRHAMVRGHQIVPTYGKRVTDVLKGMLRPALIPEPGNVFVVADWSAIEGRVHPWLANNRAGEAKLDIFRSGLDPYKVNAAATFHVQYDEVTKDQRQVGKVQELACFTAETKVLTHNGVKAIVDVRLTDKLWDGEKWVGHQGVIYKGVRKVISAQGVQVTADHLLKVKHRWVDAKTVLSNPSILTFALETGSANLPFWVTKSKKSARATNEWSKCNVLAALRRITSFFTTCLKVPQQDVTLVPKNPLDTGAKIFINTPTPVRMMTIDGDYSTGYLLAKVDATTQMIEATQITEAAGSTYTSRGAPTKPLFYATLSSLTGGINRIWNWIGLTSTKVTNQATFGLLRGRSTSKTSAKYKICSGTFSNLKPVYDILNSGNLNRFTVVCDSGYLIAHNCGFLGGVGSFETFGRVYGIQFTEAEAKRAVDGWRRANPWAMDHGQRLETAYTRAVRNPSTEFSAGRVTYLFDGTHLWYALPSGRVLCYPYAKLEDDGITYAKASWKPAADAREWPRARLWRGLACENITQATANDILRYSLRQLDGVVLHVHDEVVVECRESDADEVLRVMTDVMCTPPAWAAGLPLNIEASVMTRYGK